MKILLERILFGENYCRGRMFINDIYFCDTLEDKDRGLSFTDPIEHIIGIKIKHETAIPKGTYEVFIRFSNRFQRELPTLKDVPGFEGILIHSGNTNDDTSGCILVGEMDDDKSDRIINSRIISDRLYNLLKQLPQDEFIEITIR